MPVRPTRSPSAGPPRPASRIRAWRAEAPGRIADWKAAEALFAGSAPDAGRLRQRLGAALRAERRKAEGAEGYDLGRHAALVRALRAQEPERRTPRG